MTRGKNYLTLLFTKRETVRNKKRCKSSSVSGKERRSLSWRRVWTGLSKLTTDISQLTDGSHALSTCRAGLPCEDDQIVIEMLLAGFLLPAV